MHAVVTGGGTAGHVVPAMPVIEALQARGWTVTFIGTGSGLEEALVAPLGVAFEAITTGKLRRYFSFENLIDAFRVPLGIWQAYRLIGRLRPDVVFSKGGFVSFPVVVGAWLRHVPVVAHESDLTPGLANRLAAPFVAVLCTNFAATAASAKRRVVTGTPLRPALLGGAAAEGRALLGFDGGKPVLVVTGGSLGAARLNEVVRASLAALLERFDVVHVCGDGKLEAGLVDRPGYRQFEFVGEGWGDMLAAADVVVSRAGANTLYELLALRKPNLLVPLPAAASRGDQLENAAFAESEGFSRVLAEDALTPDALVGALDELVADLGAWRSRLAAFETPDSVALIVAELDRAAGRRNLKSAGEE